MFWQPFDVKRVYYARHDKGDVYGAQWIQDQDEFMRMCDVITLNVPLTDATRGLINRERLYKMKRGVYIVNNARGALCEREAIVEAMKEGQLAGNLFWQTTQTEFTGVRCAGLLATPHRECYGTNVWHQLCCCGLTALCKAGTGTPCHPKHCGFARSANPWQVSGTLSTKLLLIQQHVPLSCTAEHAFTSAALSRRMTFNRECTCSVLFDAWLPGVQGMAGTCGTCSQLHRTTPGGPCPSTP